MRIFDLSTQKLLHDKPLTVITNHARDWTSSRPQYFIVYRIGWAGTGLPERTLVLVSVADGKVTPLLKRKLLAAVPTHTEGVFIVRDVAAYRLDAHSGELTKLSALACSSDNFCKVNLGDPQLCILLSLHRNLTGCHLGNFSCERAEFSGGDGLIGSLIFFPMIQP